MTGALRPFAPLLEACHRDLAAIVPEIDKVDETEVVDALAALIALTHCQIRVRQRDNDIAAVLTCKPSPISCPPARALLDHCDIAIATPLVEQGHHPSFALDSWLDEHGLLRLITRLVEAGVGLDAINRLAAHIADATERLHMRLTALAVRHLGAVLKRDLDFQPGHRQTALGRPLHWVLTTDLAGQAGRMLTLERRKQALAIYGSIASILMDREITAAIDDGRPLNPLLVRRLGVTEAHLRRLQNIWSVQQAMASTSDMMGSLRKLLLHEVPLHQWPQADEWDWRRWDESPCENLFRPDYVGGDTERRDAINALREDILYPLATSRAEQAGLMADYEVASFARSFYVPPQLSHSEQHRAWLRALRDAVIGSRGIKSFHGAIAVWHRRAATVAAVRHEQTTDKPGWPALCPEWTASDGVHSIVPLTSAADLVAEGNALNHCVGGYYPQCRRGDTQIFSVRRDKERLATLELVLTYRGGKALSIARGQFKSHGNSRPADHLQPVVRAFLDDLRAGCHPIAHSPLLAHSRQMQRDGDHAWRSTTLPLDHARKAWPLYHALLPKGAPDSFDQWAEQSGLMTAFDRITRAIAQQRRAKA